VNAKVARSGSASSVGDVPSGFSALDWVVSQDIAAMVTTIRTIPTKCVAVSYSPRIRTATVVANSGMESFSSSVRPVPIRLIETK
jgi:hypothetical protein